MKKRLSLILFIFTSTFIFSQTGILWNSGTLKTVQTKWFDIIYPEDSKESAKLLYKNVDKIYEEVANSYGMEPSCRMPIVLTPEVEVFNAYWSNGYYNHIVLYDTASDESLEVFSEDLLSTFRHEVTHAFTYNMKNGFWKVIGNIFGDGVSAVGLLTTSGWAEGATLASESSFGEGRLNNEYAKHIVKQAKIEDVFPSYSDVQGARDIYPYGSYYYFNGAFNEWLQKNYGMEKYAQMWYKLVNPTTLFIESAFKKVYGIKLDDAWSKFYEDYAIPNIEKNPVEAKIVQDFFVPQKNKYSKKNQNGAIYESLSKTEKGFYYLDSESDILYFVDNENLFAKPKKILNLKNLQNISASNDGRFIALTYYYINQANVKTRAAIYDCERKNIFYVNQNGLKNNSIIKNGDDYYLVSEKFHSQKKDIYIQKIEITKNKIKNVNFVATIPLLENNSANSFTDIENGKFAFINKNGLLWSIKIADLNGKILADYDFPFEKIVLKNLSFYKNDEKSELLFSFTTPNQMPKLGKLLLNENKFYFWDENISGGVFYPTKNEEKIVFIGDFYLQNRIFFKNEDEISYEILDVQNVLENLQNQNLTENFDKNESENDDFESSSTKYKGHKYFFNGTFLPYSVVTSVSYDAEHSNGDYALPFGFTFLTKNPYDSAAVLISAGYGFSTNSFGSKISYSSGTSTSVLNYSFETSLEFDKKGFKQTNSSISVGSGFRVGKYSSISASTQSIFHYGRSNLSYANSSDSFIASSYDENSKNYFYNVDAFILQFSNVHKTGQGKFENFGFSFAPIFDYIYYEKQKNPKEVNFSIFDVSFAAKFYVPKLLPIENKNGITFNLPLKISTYLFYPFSQSSEISFYDRFPTYSMANANAEILLFQKEIQKAFPIIKNLLYINEIRLYANYYCGFDYQKGISADSWKITKMQKYFSMIKNNEILFESYPYLNLEIALTPNCGGMANSDYKSYFNCKFGAIPYENKYIPICDFSMILNF